MWDERAVADFAETLRQVVTEPPAPSWAERVAGQVADEVMAAVRHHGPARTGPCAGMHMRYCRRCGRGGGRGG